jgi:hypothetical protein
VVAGFATTVAHEARAYDPLVDDQRFDLVDMLPARAGALMLTRAEAQKGPVALHLPPTEHAAVGSYHWAREPGSNRDRVPLAAELRGRPDATVTCSRAVPDSESGCTDKGSKVVTIAGKAGCWWPEEKRCGQPGWSGAMVAWPGCRIQFACAGAALRKPAAAVAVAREIEPWASWFRSGRPTPPPGDLRAHRQALLDAIKLQPGR